MKKNIRFFTVVISLLLISTFILTGCMYAIASDNGEAKAYDLNAQSLPNSGNNVIEDSPTAQLPLMSKFNEYLHSDGNAVTVFSEEQYAELKAVRDGGNRIPLTYDEILFLINDSINLYFKHEMISLYNANIDGCLPFTLMLSTVQSSSSCIIFPYHGDFSEFNNYDDALNRYERMLQEIYAIIYYRIYMHDAGFTDVIRSFDKVIAPSEREAFYEAQKYFSIRPMTEIYQMLAIDGSAVGGTENGEKLAKEFSKVVGWEIESSASHVDPDKTVEKLNAPILSTQIRYSDRTTLEYRFYIYESMEKIQIVYPTKELTEMKPKRSVTYLAVSQDGNTPSARQPVFTLDYGIGRAIMSQSMLHSFAMVGTFEEQDGVLKLYFEDAYSYVFHEKDGGYIYVAKDSKPLELGGFDWHEDIEFKVFDDGVTPETGLAPTPPETDGENEPIAPNEEWAYIKYDANNDYCSLLSFDGGNGIDGGSYIKEDDKLVFMFKTSDGVYTYYFNYVADGLYSYAKGQSSPVPGYEFEDGQEFSLAVFDNCSSCILETKGDKH